MKIIDKREGSWRVLISNQGCPHLTYPRSDIACNLLENKPENNTLEADTYCYFKNCPLKQDRG